MKIYNFDYISNRTKYVFATSTQIFFPIHINFATTARRRESSTLGHFLVSIFFRQLDDEESKNKCISIAG